MKKMITQSRSLLIFLLITFAVQSRAQTIDSFYIDRSVNPHELFVRLHFPDSSYYVVRTFDRVAMMYPPVNVVTFFYRSCELVKVNPVRDIVIPIYTPEPYRVQLWLANDTNTATPGCVIASEVVAADSASYDSQPTGIPHTVVGNDAIQIFPNPAAGVLYVKGEPGSELQISDGLGRLQLQQKLQSQQETININALVPGLYYIHCFRDGQRLQSHCFTKLP
jgi:hypothetical protein